MKLTELLDQFYVKNNLPKYKEIKGNENDLAVFGPEFDSFVISKINGNDCYCKKTDLCKLKDKCACKELYTLNGTIGKERVNLAAAIKGDNIKRIDAEKYWFVTDPISL